MQWGGGVVIIEAPLLSKRLTRVMAFFNGRGLGGLPGLFRDKPDRWVFNAFSFKNEPSI